MMNIRNNKGIICVVTALLILAGSFLIGNSTSQVVASNTQTISDDVLSVKCQVSSNKDMLRMVTTVDGHKNYKNVGFYVTFLGDDTVEAKSKTGYVTTLFPRIKSSEANQAVSDYDAFGPKAFDAESEWFATYTVKNIPPEYQDNGIIIRPFVIMKGTTTKVWGQSRYITMEDQTDGIISLPVKGKLGDDTSVDGLERVEKPYYDTTTDYTHVRASVDYDALKSVTTYIVKDGEKEYLVKYRWLYSTTTQDTSWYEEGKGGVVVTAGDMQGFQLLARTNAFATDTIYLGADINLNLNWDAKKPTEGESTKWTPIGRSATNNSVMNPFSGIFDGDGHTIKGVYVESDLDRIGLFAATGANSVIKDFIIENSYINSTKGSGTGAVGSIVGRLGGTLSEVKSSADVVLSGAEFAGGLVGDITEGTTVTISNCCFAGIVSGKGSHHGTLIGGINNSQSSKKTTVIVEKCLSTGQIDYQTNTGGLVGSLWKNATIEMSDTLFAGKFEPVVAAGTNNTGTVIGNTNGANATYRPTISMTINNVYVKEDDNLKASLGNTGTGTDIAAQKDNVYTKSATEVMGDAAYGNMDLDFYIEDFNEDATWMVMSEGVPQLTKFADKKNAADLTKAPGTRTAWYDPTNVADTYVICTAPDFRGFQELSATVEFDDIEIKLGKDINLNPEWKDGEDIPASVTQWTPIGRSATDTSKVTPFKGIFNGQGHTIKGVYVDSALDKIGLFAATGANSVIKDFIIENSYINSTKGSGTGAVGSVVGLLGGTLNEVKSSADVVLSGSEFAGGLVGDIKEGAQVTISNCWFAGSVSGTGGHHGTLLGGINKYNSTLATTVTIEQCLSTGQIDYQTNTGGLVGSLWKNVTIEMSDTLFAGKFEPTEVTNPGNCGTVIGNTNGANATYRPTISMTIDNVYVKEDDNLKASLGNTGTGTDIAAQKDNVHTKPATEVMGDAAYGNMDLDFYTEGFNEDATWMVMSEGAPQLTKFADKNNAADLTKAPGTRTAWYDPTGEANTYVICTAPDFRGFQELSATVEFDGIEIKLGKDINLNPEWKDGEEIPENVTQWTPIGRSATDTSKVTPFKGIFNGQGHTIKGVYVDSALDKIGLFAATGANSVIKDFIIENSYINSTKGSGTGAVGSVVGLLGGTLNEVKSSADVVLSGSEFAGGLVGDIKEGAQVTISNCWFAGSVSGTGSHHGTLLGGINKYNSTLATTVTIEQCLSTGQIDYYANAGGLVGSLWKHATIEMSDTLFAGKFEPTEVAKPGNCGTVIGQTNGGNSNYRDTITVELDNVYVKEDATVTETLGNAGAKFAAHKDNISTKTEAELTGVSSYRKTALDFYLAKENETGKWVVFENGTPILKSFAEDGYIDLTNYIRPDTSWYAKEPYEISTVEQLYGLAELSETEPFTNKTITLTKDIVINQGDASAWGKTAPKYEWIPIQNFAGTFDGNMHTVSGIYLTSATVNLGMFSQVSGTVRELIVENSYIENQLTKEVGTTGSIVGKLSGTLDTVKSSADVVLNGSEYAGGLVGRIDGTKGTITNCWFAGSISGAGNHHGTLLGGINTQNSNGYIEHSLSTGTIDLNSARGGLVGAIWNPNIYLEITDTLFAGQFIGSGENLNNISNTFGRVYKCTIKLTDVYIQGGTGCGTDLGPVNGDTNNSGTILSEDATRLEVALLQGDKGYFNTNLDFYIKGIRDDSKWIAVEGSHPTLRSFSEKEGINLLEVEGNRKAWYKPTTAADTFKLYTPADFRGFQALSVESGKNFADDTVMLGADIDLNPGWEAKQTPETPDNTWTPIGYSGFKTGALPFAGTFDGDMHSIKGMYINTDKSRLGLFGHVTGAVKNLVLENSYIESTATSNGRIGSVVGILNGILDTVKAEDDVFVVSNNTQYLGGLVGSIDDYNSLKGMITNCWFAGNLSGSGEHHGGILGGLYAPNNKKDQEGSIEHCLVTGTIETYKNTGGICGSAWVGSTLTLTDSLFAGDFERGEKLEYVGTILGNVSNGVMSVSNAYVLKKNGAVVSSTIGLNKTSAGVQVVPDNAILQIEERRLALGAAAEHTNLAIYDESVHGTLDENAKKTLWYPSEKHPILASFGEPATFQKLKVATFNIGKCVKAGTTSAEVLQGVIQFIRVNNIDVCFLQEVDVNSDRSNNIDQITTIATDLNYHYAYAETLADVNGGEGYVGSYGIAIVSKYPIKDIDRKFIDDPNSIQDERRALLRGMIDIDEDGTGDVATICSHFDNKVENARRLAVEELENMVGIIKEHYGQDMPIIFGGDLNQAYIGDFNTKFIQDINTFLTSTTYGRTDIKTIYNGEWWQLDYIFINDYVKHGYATVEEPKIGSTELSDHRPLVVNLYLNIQK